jgi:hypothetical protein
MTAPVGFEGGDNIEAADAEMDSIIESAMDEHYGESSEAPDSGEPAPSEEAQPEPDEAQPGEAQDRGDGRDERGRFAKGEQETVEAQPEGEAPEAGSEEATVEGEGEAAEPLPEVTFRADGQEFSFPGSEAGEDGVFIPKDQLDTARQLWAAGRTHLTTFRQKMAEKDAEVQTARQHALKAVEAANTRSNHVLEKFQELMAQWKTDPDKVTEFFENAHVNLPVLKAEAEAKQKAKEAELKDQRLKQLEARSQAQTLIPQMRNRVAEAVVYFAKQYDLDKGPAVALYRRLSRNEGLGKIFKRGQDGQFQEDLGVIRDEVEYLASVAPRRSAQRKRTTEVNEAAQKVAKGERKATRRPGVSAKKGTKAPGTEKKVEMPKNTQEADEFLSRGKYHQFFD